MKAVVLIPWRDAGDDRRAQLWDWAQWWLARIGWPVVTAEGPDGEFSRAGAINEAAAKTQWDVALIGDADTIQDRDSAERGARRALEVGMCIPWTHRVKLSRPATDRLIRAGLGAVTTGDVDPGDRASPHGGGATVCVSREAFEAVGGFDGRFVGYGNEDLAFRAAVETLVIGNGSPREHGFVWHLWHKPHPRVGTVRAATPRNQELWEAYRRARWKPEAMRKVMG